MDTRWQKTQAKLELVNQVIRHLETMSVDPDHLNPHLEEGGNSLMRQKAKADSILNRPEISLETLIRVSPEIAQQLQGFSAEVLEQAEIQIKYAGYIKKEREMAEKMIRLDDIRLPEKFDYSKVKALSFEGKEKLSRSKPQSLGQASRISGVTPADISVLMIYMGR